MPPKKLPWNVRGEKLKTHLTYSPAGLQLQRRHLDAAAPCELWHIGPIDAAVDLSVKFERDHLQVSQGKFRTASSQIDFSGDLRDLKTPEITGTYTAHVAAQRSRTHSRMANRAERHHRFVGRLPLQQRR